MLSELRHRGPDGEGFFEAPGSRARPRAARDHRPLRRRPAAVRERRRRAPAPPQRRGLQLPRASRRAGAAGPPLPHPDGHRGRAPRVRAVGAVVREPLQRHVGARALGRPRAAALLLPRPLRDQAVRVPPRRRPPRVRERAARLPPRPLLPGARRTPPRSATSSRRATPIISTRRSSPASATCRPGTRSRSTPAASRLDRYWTLEPRDPPADPRRDVQGALPRLGPAAPAQRRPTRHGALGRARLLRGRGRDRPSAAHGGGERAPRRRSPADVHRLLRGRGLRRAAVRRGRRRADPLRPALGLVRRRRRCVDLLPEVVGAQGEPFASSSIVAQWFVMRAAAAAGLKVMLDGQGGDEVLAGYRDHLRLPARRPARRRAPPRRRPPSCGRSRSRSARCPSRW